MAVVLSMVVGACGITTSPDRGVADDIEDAAQATADLDFYEFTWTAEYDLSESETGRSELTVAGSGVVEAGSGNVESVVDYDEDLLDVTRSLFADEDITQVQAFTRIIGDAIYIRGFHAAALIDELAPDFETWYEVGRRNQNVRDPLVRSQVLPADVLPVVVEPLVDAGETSVPVDRDFVLDLGTRFPSSLYDFGLLIGGSDFDVSVDIVDGLIGTLVLDGDDPGTGVERFTFTIEFVRLSNAEIDPPPGVVAVP